MKPNRIKTMLAEGKVALGGWVTMGSPVAAEIMSQYPNYRHMDKVYFYLGDSYLMLRLYDQAIPFFTKVVTDYSGQKLAKTASQRLAEIGRGWPAQRLSCRRASASSISNSSVTSRLSSSSLAMRP